MKTHRSAMRSAVLSLALLGLAIIGTLPLGGCVTDEELAREREKAVAVEKGLREQAGDQAATATTLEDRLNEAAVARAQVEEALAKLEAGSEEWARTRELLLTIDTQVAAATKALAAADQSAAAALKKADEIKAAIAEGDKALASAGDPDNPATTAAGIAGAFFPGLSAVLTTIIAPLGWKTLKLNQARNRYRAAAAVASETANVKASALDRIVSGFEWLKTAEPAFIELLKKHKPALDGIQGREAKAEVDRVQTVLA